MKVLVVVDMQNDFIDGALGSAEAVSIVPSVAVCIRAAHAEGASVVFTRDTHGDDYLSTQEGRLLPVPHCIQGTWGWQLHREMDTEGASLLNKGSFGSLALPTLIRGLGQIEQIELVGLCTDICVISNALILKAAFPETLVSVVSTACAGVTPAAHQNALDAMRSCQVNVL